MGMLVNIRVDEASEGVAAEKERTLLARLGELASVIVALSGGIDSAYLAWAADRGLGEKALSVTALSESDSAYDREQVEAFVKAAGVRHDGAVGFNSEESPLWSVCEDPGLVPHFIANPEFMATNLARRIDTPWAGGDKMIRAHVPDWSGYAIWGNPTNRNVWIRFHARPQP